MNSKWVIKAAISIMKRISPTTWLQIHLIRLRFIVLAVADKLCYHHRNELNDFTMSNEVKIRGNIIVAANKCKRWRNLFTRHAADVEPMFSLWHYLDSILLKLPT